MKEKKVTGKGKVGKVRDWMGKGKESGHNRKRKSKEVRKNRMRKRKVMEIGQEKNIQGKERKSASICKKI